MTSERGRSAARLIPVPREMLRTLINEKRPSVVLTALVYFLYGLSFERGTGNVKRAGAVKATKIADLSGLSERSIRAARAELIRLGWITKDEGSTQWKLNRTGAYFVINCEWRSEAQAGIISSPKERRGRQEPRSAQAVDNPRPESLGICTPPGSKQPQFAPPIKRLEIL